MTDYFKQTVEGFELSLEKDTDSVPKDGRYHVVKQGRTIYSTKSLVQARKKFGEILKEMGYDPEQKEKLQPNNIKELIEGEKITRFFQSHGQYWDSSYRYKKGGRLGKR
jgi:hypothetical protein